MNAAPGVDHAGSGLKQLVSTTITHGGRTILDHGTMDTSPLDNPDVARNVALAVTHGEASSGTLICGSGIGASVAANNVRGVRAGPAHGSFSARQGVEHDAMNILCMGARVIGPVAAADFVNEFPGVAFADEERHALRIEKVQKMEATDW